MDTSPTENNAPGISPDMHPPSSPKHLVPLIAGACVLLILLIVGLTLMGSKNRQGGGTDMTSMEGAPSPTQAPAPAQIKDFPSVNVSNWTVPASINVQAPSSVNVYRFQQDLTQADFTRYASRFFTVSKVSETPNRFMSTSAQGGASVFYMLRHTGSIFYTSDGGVDLPPGSTPEDKVSTFAQNMFSDKTIQMAAAYDRQTYPGIRYYEFHRNKTTLGLPVLNLIGLVNVPASTPLSTLNLADPANNQPSQDYVNSTDKSDGKTRAVDFNSITIGVKDGKVVSIASNIRPFNGAGAPNAVIPFSQAVAKLKSNNYAAMYVVPAGGLTDLNKLYPQNTADLVSATVNEATIAYMEDLPAITEKQLLPYYIFRGTGVLKNGGKVNFVASVPATNAAVLGASTDNSLTGVPVGNRTSQQQGTLKFNPSAVVGVPVTDIKPTSCNHYPSPQDLRNIQKDPITGIVYGQGLRDQGWQWTDSYGVVWYVITQNNWDINKLKEAFDTVERLTKADTGEDAEAKKRRWERAITQWEAAAAGCPVQITGATPSIFLHSDTTSSVQIQPANVVFSSPAIGAGGWNATVTGDEVSVNGTASESLYYEYKPVTYTKPQQGWVIARNGVGQFAAETAKDLGLNEAETFGLRSELNRAVADLHNNASTLFIGVINGTELNSKAPLNVKANGINVQRIHFYVSAAHGETVTEPELQPVHRSSFSLLELGATAQ